MWWATESISFVIDTGVQKKMVSFSPQQNKIDLKMRNVLILNGKCGLDIVGIQSKDKS